MPQKNFSTESSIVIAKETPAQIAEQFFTDCSTQGKIFTETIDILTEKGTSKDIAEKQIQKFCLYWTEPTQDGKRQRWQIEKTFEVRRRLATWLSNLTIHNNSPPKGISPSMQAVIASKQADMLIEQQKNERFLAIQKEKEEKKKHSLFIS